MLAQRVGSAAVGVPIIALLIYAGGSWYVAAVASLLAIASLEFQHARRAWLDPVSLLLAMLVAGIAVGAHADRYVWWGWLAGAVVIAPAAAALSPSPEGARSDALWIVAGVAYIGLLGSFLVLLRDVDFDGREWVYLAVLSTFVTDTAAYFTGRAIGRHQLAPRISPKKTVEGFAGGWIFGAAAVLALNYVLDLRVEPARITLLSAILPLAAAAGDLSESAIKRLMDIKDASELIPGHGGVMDRLDSILFTSVAVYGFVQWIQR